MVPIVGRVDFDVALNGADLPDLKRISRVETNNFLPLIRELSFQSNDYFLV